MTVNTPKGKRGKVKPPQGARPIALKVTATVGAFRKLVKTMALMQSFKDLTEPDFAGMDEAFDMFFDWMTKYGGANEEEIEGLTFPQMYDILGQAMGAFGDVPIPQMKSVP